MESQDLVEMKSWDLKVPQEVNIKTLYDSLNSNKKNINGALNQNSKRYMNQNLPKRLKSIIEISQQHKTKSTTKQYLSSLLLPKIQLLNLDNYRCKLQKDNIIQNRIKKRYCSQRKKHNLSQNLYKKSQLICLQKNKLPKLVKCYILNIQGANKLKYLSGYLNRQKKRYNY